MLIIGTPSFSDLLLPRCTDNVFCVCCGFFFLPQILNEIVTMRITVRVLTSSDKFGYQMLISNSRASFKKYLSHFKSHIFEVFAETKTNYFTTHMPWSYFHAIFSSLCSHGFSGDLSLTPTTHSFLTLIVFTLFIPYN